MFQSKSNCKVHRVEPLKETQKLRMGCAASKASMVSAMNTGSGENADDMDNTTAGAANASLDPVQYPPPEAFVVPLNDDTEREPDESLIKKHPPKRLLRLTEASVVATTIEDLEEKLAKAEIRRQKYLQERVEKIENIGLKGKNDENENSGDDEKEEQSENQNKDTLNHNTDEN